MEGVQLTNYNQLYHLHIFRVATGHCQCQLANFTLSINQCMVQLITGYSCRQNSTDISSYSYMQHFRLYSEGSRSHACIVKLLHIWLHAGHHQTYEVICIVWAWCLEEDNCGMVNYRQLASYRFSCLKCKVYIASYSYIYTCSYIASQLQNSQLLQLYLVNMHGYIQLAIYMHAFMQKHIASYKI